MAAGDTGAPKAGGGQGYEAPHIPSLSLYIVKPSEANQLIFVHSDAFTKREKANEDYAIKQREKEKLLELKRKLAEQHEHLKKLEEHM